MKVHQITKYECEVCGRQYDNLDWAANCELIPLKHDTGVKVGDTVRILSGEGSGSMARVTAVLVHEPGWGPPQYDHSVYVLADVENGWGSRQLSFDSYEVVK